MQKKTEKCKKFGKKEKNLPKNKQKIQQKMWKKAKNLEKNK